MVYCTEGGIILNKNILAIGIIFLFIISALAPMTFGYNGKILDAIEQSSMSFSRGKTLYVGGSGGDNYTRIQEAIDNASDGDTVFVFNGTYYENVVINITIDLIGEDKNTTVIDGNNHGTAVNISADEVFLSGFTVQDGGNGWDESGIIIFQSNSSVIFNNIVSNNSESGIVILFSNNNIIENNIISLNYGFGIRSRNSENTTIKGNNLFSNSEAGIMLVDSPYSCITKNYIFSNEWHGLKSYSFKDSIHDNIIYQNKKSGLWFGDATNDNTIINNTIFSNNDYGIYFAVGASRNILKYNNITLNIYSGIFLGHHVDYNHLIENNVSRNIRHGIELHQARKNTIIQNKIINNNGNGIYIRFTEPDEKANDNLLYHNTLIDHKENAMDICDNSWDNSEEGNYWGDYKDKYPDAKPRLLKPWIWDTPYEIPGGDNKDMYPLVNQWPKSKPRTIQKDIASYSSYLLRFLEQFPILYRLLSLIRV